MRTLRCILKAMIRDQSGQAAAEYASVTSILLLTGMAMGTATPITKTLFIALQTYIDFYFYCLNLAVG